MELYYTNGKRLIAANKDIESLNDAVTQIQEHMMNTYTQEVQFEFSELDYPHYKVPKGVTSQHMMEALSPYLKFKAINEDVLVVDIPQETSYKHTFTADELVGLSEEMAETVQTRDEVEMERKASAKVFKDRVDSLDEKISSDARKYRQKYEIKQAKAIIRYDFVDKVKIYEDANTGAVLKSDEFLPEDYQMKMNFVGGGTSGKEDEEAPAGGGKGEFVAAFEGSTDAVILLSDDGIKAVVDGGGTKKAKVTDLHVKHSLNAEQIAGLLDEAVKGISTIISKISK